MKLNELVNQPVEDDKEDPLAEHDWEEWDREIEADLKAGKLDPAIQEALSQEGEVL